MIGRSNRVSGAHAPQIEAALAFTAPGQATWADPTIPHTCSECAHWADLKGQGQKHGSLPRILRAHAGSPRPTDRKTTAGMRSVRTRREGGEAMSKHNREARLKTSQAEPKNSETRRPVTQLARSLEAAIERSREADILALTERLGAKLKRAGDHPSHVEVAPASRRRRSEIRNPN